MKYQRAVIAREFIDWLIQEGEVTLRSEGEQLCCRLLEYGIIQHGEKLIICYNMKCYVMCFRNRSIEE